MLFEVALPCPACNAVDIPDKESIAFSASAGRAADCLYSPCSSMSMAELILTTAERTDST
jgi:hypothetical protein